MKDKIKAILQENIPILSDRVIEKTANALVEGLKLRSCKVEKADDGEFALGDLVRSCKTGRRGIVAKNKEGKFCFDFGIYELPITAKGVVKI